MEIFSRLSRGRSFTISLFNHAIAIRMRNNAGERGSFTETLFSNIHSSRISNERRGLSIWKSAISIALDFHPTTPRSAFTYEVGPVSDLITIIG